MHLQLSPATRRNQGLTGPVLYMTAKKGFLTSDALTTDDVPDVAAELSEGLGRIKLKQEMVESYKNKKDVFVNDLPYTQQSISPRFGFRASLQVLVSWLLSQSRWAGTGKNRNHPSKMHCYASSQHGHLEKHSFD